MDRRDLIAALLTAGKGMIVDEGGEVAGYAFCRNLAGAWLLALLSPHRLNTRRP